MPINKPTSRPFIHATTIAHDRLDKLYGMLTHIAEQVRRNADAIAGSDDRLRDVNERIEADIVPDVDRRLTLWRLARAAMVGVSPYLSVPTDADATPVHVETDTVAALNRLYRAMHHPAGLRFDGHEWCDAIDVVKRTIDILDASACDPRYEQAIVPAVASFAETVSTIKAALDDAAPVPDETINAAESMATVVGPLLDYVRGCPDSRCPMVVDLIESTANCLNMAGMNGPNVSRCRELAATWAAVLDVCDAIADPLEAVGTEASKSVDAKAGMTWQDAKARAESACRYDRKCGKAFASRRDMAKRVGCSPSTMTKAIKHSSTLRAWIAMSAQAKPTTPLATPLNDLALDGAAQSTETDPAGSTSAELTELARQAELAQLVAEQKRDQRSERQYKQV